MRKVFLFLFLILFSLTTLTANPSSLPAFLLPGFIYDGDGEEVSYDLSDVDKTYIHPLAAAVLLEDSSIDIRDIVSGDSSSILMELFDLISVLMPIDYMQPVSATGKMVLAPFISLEQGKAGFSVSYDNAEIIFDSYGKVSIDGDITVSFDVMVDPLFSICIVPDHLLLSGNEITDSLELAVDFDSGIADSLLRKSGLNIEESRLYFCEFLIENIPYYLDEQEIELFEDMIGDDISNISVDVFASELEACEILDALDLSSFLFVADSLGMSEDLMLSVLSPYVIINDTEYVPVDVWSMIQAFEML